MIVLAIDSGLEKTGYSIFNKKTSGFDYLASGLIKTDKKELLEKRIFQLYSQTLRIVEKYHPKIIILERLFFLKNKKTAIMVSQAQGAVLLLAAIKKIAVDFLTPLEIKQSITGYGQSDKKSVEKMLRLILKIEEDFCQNDVSDAVACGLAYCYKRN